VIFLLKGIWSIPLSITLVLIIALSLLYTTIIETSTIQKTRDSIQSIEIDVDKIINNIIEKFNLNISDPMVRYSLYYSGRVLEFRGSDIPDIIGLEPEDIIFAYYDGAYWHPLPMRIYDKVIWTNVTTIYSLPERISENTTIEIKLPSKYPVYVDPRKVVPEFARASECRILKIVDKMHSMEIASIFLFIKGYVRWGLEGFQLLNSYDHTSIFETFESSEPPMLIEYMKKAGYDSKYIVNTLYTILEKPVKIGKDIDLIIEWEPPVPDGGGSGPPYINLIEIRPQPTSIMMKKDYTIKREAESHLIKLYIIDPSIQSSLKWRTLRLTIVIGLESNESDEPEYPIPIETLSEEPVVRTLEIKLYNDDYGYSYTTTRYIVSDQVNIVTISYTPTPYGSTCKYMYLNISMIDIPSGSNEVWKFRIHPSVYITWFYEYYDSDNRVRESSLYLFNDLPEENGGVQSEFRFWIPSGGSIDKKIVYIPPIQGVSLIKPYSSINISLYVSIIEADQNHYPLNVTINFGGIEEETITFYYQSTKQCILSIMVKDLALLSERYESIPITITVTSLSNDYISDGEVRIGISIVEPAKLWYRITYMLSSIDGTLEFPCVLITSTREDSDDIWGEENNKWYAVSRLFAVHSSESGGIVYVKGLEYTLGLDEFDELPEVAHYRLIIMHGGVTGIIDTGTSTEVLKEPLVDEATIYIFFPEGVNLNETIASPHGFKLSGDIPELPEIPLPLAIALSFIPYGKIASTAYAGFAWTINYIATESTNDVSVDIDRENRVITIHWVRGLFNSNDFNGVIKIEYVGLFTGSNGKEIRVEVNLVLEDGSYRSYVFYAPITK